ncbi:YraN family protein [Iodidimonas muriae]|uniref:YraN family protein n=1 Tax=Iodidimonas muriae TaxID=261467 RepID=UPI001230757D|nr:YraN family protein [Iodidimonas muriae]
MDDRRKAPHGLSKSTGDQSGNGGRNIITGKRSSRLSRKQSEKRGRAAESWAALYLQIKGYRILARRYRTPVGELDLVARRGDSLVFIEVKARQDLALGMGAISHNQRQRLHRAALAFITRHPQFHAFALRFDAIIIRPFSLPHHIVDAWHSASVGDL